jgi:NAD(P)H-dependent FMN reductase
MRVAPADVEVVRFDGLGELPPFNPDLDGPGSPEPVVRFRQAIAASDALLIVSPEYGHSLPGVLKNAIDWVVGSGELERRIVAITAAVAGPDRGRRGLEALRSPLTALSATIVGGEPIARGPEMAAEVSALVRALTHAVAATRAAQST